MFKYIKTIITTITVFIFLALAFGSGDSDEEREIENQANRIINSCSKISKSFMDKAEAEKIYGFSLY
jgi:hypothetical protein